MSSFVSSGVRSVAGKITRSALETRSSRPPASTTASSEATARSGATCPRRSRRAARPARPVGCASVAAGPSPSCSTRTEMVPAVTASSSPAAPSSSEGLPAHRLVGRAHDLVARQRLEAGGAEAVEELAVLVLEAQHASPPSPAARARAACPSSRGWSPMGWPCGHAFASASSAYMRCSSDSRDRVLEGVRLLVHLVPGDLEDLARGTPRSGGGGRRPCARPRARAA